MIENIARDAALLPRHFHNDPADCMITATARVERALLLTRDEGTYGQAGHIRVMEAWNFSCLCGSDDGGVRHEGPQFPLRAVQAELPRCNAAMHSRNRL
jgi:hypothetical protein